MPSRTASLMYLPDFAEDSDPAQIAASHANDGGRLGYAADIVHAGDRRIRALPAIGVGLDRDVDTVLLEKLFALGEEHRRIGGVDTDAHAYGLFLRDRRASEE